MFFWKDLVAGVEKRWNDTQFVDGRKRESDETDLYLFLLSHRSAISHHTRLCKDIVFMVERRRAARNQHETKVGYGRQYSIVSNDGAYLPH